MSALYECVHLVGFVLFVFFFKQKTAYEMRISDWSSDVCSSDLRSGCRTGLRSWRRAAARSDLSEHCRSRTCHRRAALAGTLRLPPWSRRSHRCANPVIGKRQGRPESHRPGQGCTGSTEAWLLSSDVSLGISRGRRSPSSRGRSEEHTSELQSLLRISY